MQAPPTLILPWLYAIGLAVVAAAHPQPAMAEEYVEVCVGGDRVMRKREDHASHCPAGEESLRMSLWQQEEPEEEDEPEEDDEQAEENEDDRDDTARRFTAPFEIVDSAGKVIFSVEASSDGLSPSVRIVHNGQPLVQLGADDEGGTMQLRRTDGSIGAELKAGLTSHLKLNDERTPAAALEASEYGAYLTISGNDSSQAQLAAWPNTSARMMLSNKEGAPVVELVGDDHGLIRVGKADGAAISLTSSGAATKLSLSRASDPGIVLATSAGGHPNLTFFHSKEQPSLVLGGYQDRGPGLRLHSEQGKQVAAIGMDESGDGAVRIRAAGNEGGVDINGGGSTAGVAVIDPGGRPRAAMQIIGSGQGALQVHNSSGEVMSVLTQGDNGGQLQIANNGGTPLVEAGVIASGVGVVRTGPGASLQTSMTIPSFIMGKVAGQ